MNIDRLGGEALLASARGAVERTTLGAAGRLVRGPVRALALGVAVPRSKASRATAERNACGSR
jgi:hypothetical protein